MSLSKNKISQLQGIAREIRINIIKMLTKAGSGHPGGSLSIADILVFLYCCIIRVDPKNPAWPDRDIFILSKGHGCPALYAVLAYCGFFAKRELLYLRKLGSMLQGHTFFGVPGVEASTGSLGQGLSIANGFALGAKLDHNSKRVYCVVGDGEMEEGQIWEAMMTAHHYKLDNLCVILDNNNLQIDGSIDKIRSFDHLQARIKAFGWHYINTDGHDFAALNEAFDEVSKVKGKPSMIIAHTVKGKGVSFMEGKVKWHGIAPKKEESDLALGELCKNNKE